MSLSGRERRARVHLKDGETVMNTVESYVTVARRYAQALGHRNERTGTTTVRFTWNGRKQTIDVDYIARVEESP